MIGHLQLGGPCDRGRWRGMRAALPAQLLASVKWRGHGGGFGSDNGAEWVIWALYTKARHIHPVCAYAHVSIRASLRMQATCLWRAHNLLGRDCGHPVDNCSLCPILKDDGAFAPLQGRDYAGSMHRHGYA